MCRQFPFISTCWVAAPGGRQFEFNNEEERREAIDHIREMARRKYLGEREVGGGTYGRKMGGLESWEPSTPMEDERLEPTNEPNLEKEHDLPKEKHIMLFSPPNSGQTSPLHWET